MAENEVRIPSFFDFDEPNLDEVGAEVSTTEEPKKKEEAKAETPAAGPQAADLYQSIAQIDAQREAQRQAQAAQEAQIAENRKRWAELHTPPPLPEGEAAESLVTDPEAILEIVRKDRVWTQNLLRAYGGAMTQLRQETASTIEQAQAATAAATIQASRVSSMVANKLKEEGYEDIDEAMDEADAALAADSSRYLSYRTSPAHFDQAVRYVLSQRQVAPRQPQMRQPARGVASGPVLPYTPAAHSPSTADVSASGMSREDIAKAQRLLGHKFSADALRKAGVVG